MPIPQLEKKPSRVEHIRDASSLRRKRASSRRSDRSPQKLRDVRERIVLLFRKENIAKTLIGCFIGGFGLCLLTAGVAYAWVSKDLASIADVEARAINESTKIYARDGQTVLYELGDNKRADVPLDQIDEEIRQATIALEDRDFYEHSGFKIRSIVRALLANLTGGFIVKGQGGASTLTQQFIKNAILTNERTYTRKLKEVILAVRLEQKYSKDEVLNMYLNEIYYGANYQGVQTASLEYFGKPASDVSLAQAATLAAIPQDPVDLPREPERLKARRDYALEQMAALGYITQEESEAAKLEEVVINEQVTKIKAPHFVFMVSSYLEEKYGQTTVRKGGLKVVTTLDWDKQQKAETAITDGMAKVDRYGGDNAALVSMDTHTGQILALVGSRDFFDEEHDGQFNVATSFNRQPGSSFKPIVYLTAYTKGYTPDTKLYDVETDFPSSDGGATYHPHNFSGEGAVNGPLTMRSALARSLNIPAVKTMYLVGVDNALNMAESLGYTSLKDRSTYGLSLALGAGGVSLVEHTAAFGTFAREGVYHAPSTILTVYDKNGKVLEEWKNEERRAVDEQYARMLNSVLSDSAARGSTFATLNLSDRPTAAKTGTSNDFRDAWTMGFTPSVVTGVWTGRNDFQPMGHLADGIVIAAPIWQAYMASILTGTPREDFKTPSYTPATEVLGGNIENIVTKPVDAISGAIIPDECLATYPAEYVATKDFKETHTILHYIDKEDPTGAAPEDPTDDPMYNSWENAVQAWVKGAGRENEYLSDSTPRTSCDMRDPNQQPEVTITSLEDNVSYARSEFAISANVKPGKGRTITAVEYIIDVITVDSAPGLSITSDEEVTSTYRPKTLTAGKHTVRVRVTDDNGNTAESSVDVGYLGK
jgi:1A family penicillin-binding protein